MHILCLIYSNCEYYSKPVRIITLMREICNLIIDRTIKYLDSSTIFQIEPEEAMDKVSLCYQTLKIFKSTFRQYKDTIPSYFESRDEKKMWTFQVIIIINNEKIHYIDYSLILFCRMIWYLGGSTSFFKDAKYFMNFVLLHNKSLGFKRLKLVELGVKYWLRKLRK